MDTERPLTAGQARFIDELVADPTRNATAAYERVYAARGAAAAAAASRLMADPRVIAEIERRDEATADRNKLSVDRLVTHLTELVEANPNDLTEWRVGACRYCWGHNHQYQYKQSELDDALAFYKKTAEGKADPLCAFFNYRGGVGYMRTRDPNPHCPECEGQGEGYEVIKDTRKVPPAAARLFAGIKRTKDGLQILTRSQDKALELAMRAAGMLKDARDDDEQGPPPSTTVTYVEQDASEPAQAPTTEGQA